ncbi:hypothetical protein RJT34_23749 [Clitoria ternatea]|uniref:Uncharacterized protein n=1 Tax=Clitoria ternatea TaxID=43366 RepID=A0AAN9FT98_CLITE
MFKMLKRMERLEDGEYFLDEEDVQCQIDSDRSNINCGGDSDSGALLNDVCGSGSRGEFFLNGDCVYGSTDFDLPQDLPQEGLGVESL